MNLNQVKRAFTLVELLAVLILLGILSAMVLTATNGVIEQARETRTEKIIASIDSVIQEKYRSYKYRPLSVEIPETATAITNSNTPANEIGYEVLANEAARARLMMVRDLQRMELPDRLSDIRWGPSVIRAAANPVFTDASDNIVGSRDDKTVRRMFVVSWYDSSASYINGGDNIPAKLAAYRQRLLDIEALSGSAFNFAAPNVLQNQGAECLYLIMATSYVGTGPAIDVIPDSNIGDTDGDGLLEILDGWGQPLEFVRWPVGVADFGQSAIVSAAPSAATPELTPVPDDFDLFRTDYAYAKPQAVPPATPTWTPAVPINVNRPAGTPVAPELKPWSMRPLIFSRGPNREGGIATNPWTSGSIEVPTFSYRTSAGNAWNWPVTAPYYGTELPGRDRGVGSTTFTEHPFIDPYMRRFVAANGGGGFTGLLPGQLLGSSLAFTQAADNITNYQLQATPR